VSLLLFAGLLAWICSTFLLFPLGLSFFLKVLTISGPQTNFHEHVITQSGLSIDLPEAVDEHAQAGARSSLRAHVHQDRQDSELLLSSRDARAFVWHPQRIVHFQDVGVWRVHGAGGVPLSSSC
jgi:hypothetical protein